MRENKGSALAQYAIIIALVVIPIIGIFFLFGQTIADTLGKYTTVFEQNYNALCNNVAGDKAALNKNNNTPSDNTPEPGTNTPDPEVNPPPPSVNVKMTCSAGLCKLDYGSYVLNGIPENFADYKDKNRASGSTGQIVALLEQLKSQSEAKGDTNAVNKLAALIAKGKDIGNIESLYEDIIEPTEKYINIMSNYSDICMHGYRDYAQGKITYEQYLKIRSDAKKKTYYLNGLPLTASLLMTQGKQMYAKSGTISLSDGNTVKANIDDIRTMLNPNGTVFYSGSSILEQYDDNNYATITNSSLLKFEDVLKNPAFKQKTDPDLGTSEYSPIAQYMSALNDVVNDKNISDDLKAIVTPLSKELYDTSQFSELYSARTKAVLDFVLYERDSVPQLIYDGYEYSKDGFIEALHGQMTATNNLAQALADYASN